MNGINFHQSFDYHVRGEGNCATEKQENFMSIQPSSAEFEGQTKQGKEFNINSQTYIYPNYEQTMSFLIQISFKSLKQTSKSKKIFKM